MTVCPTCHLTQPCWCDGTPPATPRPTTYRRHLALPARRVRPRPSTLAHRGNIPPAGGVCPLDHRDQAAPDLPADRYVCDHCTGRLRGLLTDLPGLADDLQVALVGTVRFTQQRGGDTIDALGPSDAAYVLRATILANLDWITSIRAHNIPQTWAGIGAYLRTSLTWAAQHPDGPQYVDELTHAITNARRAIDRPADRHYLGTCNGTTLDPDGLAQICREPLYAPDYAKTTRCPRCGTPWPTADLRTRQLDRIAHHQVSAVDAERIFAEVGIDIPARLIRKWKHRRELDTAGVDKRGRPLYEIGAILARNAKTA